MKRSNLKKAARLARKHDELTDKIQQLTALAIEIENGADIMVDIHAGGQYNHRLKLNRIENALANVKTKLEERLVEVEAEIDLID